ncbi:tomoregulin-2-like protein [Cricetulus griseus]|nr:tomoregulin-2-like protein [Cricetulus griseus]
MKALEKAARRRPPPVTFASLVQSVMKMLRTSGVLAHIFIPRTGEAEAGKSSPFHYQVLSRGIVGGLDNQGFGNGLQLFLAESIATSSFQTRFRAIRPHRCVCNIDCSQTNFNPLCASDGKSYDNACQIKEASCQKQEKIEVMSLGRCQDNTTTTTKSEDGHYARTDYAENANKLEESAREHHIPCPEHYNGFCMHGKCEHSINMQEPSCRCDAGYTGQHCEKKDYSVLYVVPGPVRFQYVLIAAVIGTIQIAVICVVVLCITRKCPRSNRIHRQKQNTGHYSSDNTTRASTREQLAFVIALHGTVQEILPLSPSPGDHPTSVLFPSVPLAHPGIASQTLSTLGFKCINYELKVSGTVWQEFGSVALLEKVELQLLVH